MENGRGLSINRDAYDNNNHTDSGYQFRVGENKVILDSVKYIQRPLIKNIYGYRRMEIVDNSNDNDYYGGIRINLMKGEMIYR